MGTLLELDLTGEFMEDVGPSPLEKMLARRRVVLRTIIDRLASASEDPDVVGLLTKVGATSMSLAYVQELTDAVARFRASGKATICFAESFGELGRGTTGYVLACGFDEIWLQPSGSIGLMGAAAAGVFVRGALDRAEIEPLFAQRHEFKNAADTFMRTGFTEAHREATERLARSAYEQIVSAVATARKLTEDEVRELVDRAPIFASEALEAGLVDHLGYRGAVREALDKRWAEMPTLLYLSRYRRRWENLRRTMRARRPAVGLIEAVGAIQSGRSRRGPGARAAGSDTVAAALRAAVGDDRTRAIVLRVNSRGGSYVASDTIWHEVCRARESGKPIVASMGDIAGSGGYYVAMGADVIVAEPATLTGSIGVVAGKLKASGLFERFGVNVENIAHGRHALMFSAQSGFSEEEWARLDEWLDSVYDDFTGKVAQGRSMTREAVHEVARGRVWTGADAAERGLVDELGGLQRAVEIARERAGLPRDALVRRIPSPSPMSRLRKPQNSDDPNAFAQARVPDAALFGWEEHAHLAAILGLPSSGPLTMTVGPLR